MNIFKQFIVSLYSPKDIATFRLQKIGKTILYVFLLSLIVTIPLFIQFTTFFNKGLTHMEKIVRSDIPDFQIADGMLSSDAKEPVSISQGDLTIVFDSTGSVIAEDIENNTIALLQDELVVNMDGVIDRIPYTTLELPLITKDQLIDFFQVFDTAKPILFVILFVIFYLVQSAWNFFKATILALIGLLIKNSLRPTLKFGQLWRLSAYAVTLPTIFFLIMDMFQAQVPFQMIINWGVMIIMLYLSIKEIPITDVTNE